MILFGIVSESFHRSYFSAVAFLAPPAQAVAKRDHQSIDDVQEFTGA